MESKNSYPKDKGEFMESPENSSPKDKGEFMDSNNSSPPKKLFVRDVEMSDDMVEQAVKIAGTALEKHSANKKDVAAFIKKMFDKLYGPHWHCVVGNFGFSQNYEKQHYIFFTLEETTILLYKTPSKRRFRIRRTVRIFY